MKHGAECAASVACRAGTMNEAPLALRNDSGMSRLGQEAAEPRGMTMSSQKRSAPRDTERSDEECCDRETRRFPNASSNDIKLSGERSESAAARC